MKKHLSYFLIFSIYYFLIINTSSCQQRIEKTTHKPVFDSFLNKYSRPIGFVNDYAGLYTKKEVNEMDTLLSKFANKTSIQIIMVTLDSLMAGASEIEEVTQTLGNAWKIGGDSSKGVVIGISKAYKKMRIENGRYIQKILSDSETKEIIDSFFIPYFKNDQYFEGSLSGIKALMDIVKKSILQKITIKF